MPSPEYEPKLFFLASGPRYHYGCLVMLGEHQIMALLRLKGVGPRSVEFLLRKKIEADSVAGLWEALKPYAAEAPWSGIDKAALLKAWNVSAEMLGKITDRGLVCLGYWSPLFPSQLREIPKPPVILFVQGAVEGLSLPSIAIIGTREPTPFGSEAAKRIATNLARRGLVIVSGLAEGCDTAGHVGCLEGKGRTVAVLAHGHGQIYPKSNIALADRIISSGGSLVSEYVPDSPPMRSRFVERDRLQSGLAKAILVIETGVEGGTMHTVRAAKEQKRAIAALAHPMKWSGTVQSSGNRMLIANGDAESIADVRDLENFVEKIFNQDNARDFPDYTENQLGLF